ncbi:D-arabinose 1-dehydrogenase, Zn-dependent alcohol dehydrogenase family, partial [Candidatus Methanophagaceae archaeon]
MKAAVLSGIENMEITEVNRPTSNSNEVLLKLEACAICKTDTKMFHAG